LLRLLPWLDVELTKTLLIQPRRRRRRRVPATTAATKTTTTEAVIGSDGLLVTYDGTVCDYSGPDSLRLDDEVAMTFVNSLRTTFGCL
jgi:hypothetical protein